MRVSREIKEVVVERERKINREGQREEEQRGRGRVV